MKTLTFRHHLIKLILDGVKTTTWRLFDDKSLSIGDMLNLRDWETGKTVARAEIIEVREKKCGELTDEDFDGHETFKDENDMLNHFREWYGRNVHADTAVKIIKFQLHKDTKTR